MFIQQLSIEFVSFGKVLQHPVLSFNLTQQLHQPFFSQTKGGRWEHGPPPGVCGKIIDGLLLPSGKAYTLLTDHLITGKPLWFEPAQEKWFKPTHPYI